VGAGPPGCPLLGGMGRCPKWSYAHSERRCPHTTPVLWVTGWVQGTPAPHGELLGLAQAGMEMPRGDAWQCPMKVTNSCPAPRPLPTPTNFDLFYTAFQELSIVSF